MDYKRQYFDAQLINLTMDYIHGINIKFTKDIVKLLYNNIINKINEGWTNSEILYWYDLYSPIVEFILDNINKLFNYRYGQEIAHQEFNNVLKLSSYWGLLVCPTGYGKSILHYLFISSYMNNNINKNCMITTKRKDILNDVMISIKKTLEMLKLNGILNNIPIVINQVSSFNANTINKAKNSIIIINIDKLITKATSINWTSIGFVIFDEVHWLSGEKTFRMALHIKKYVKYCIGSSATPIRSDKDSRENIGELFGNPLNVLYNISYADAWEHNIITPIYHKYLTINKHLFLISKDNNDNVTYKLKPEAKTIMINNISLIANKTIYKKIIGFCNDKKSVVDWYNFLKSNNKFNNYNIYVSFTKDTVIIDYIKKYPNINIYNYDQITDFKQCPNNSILLVVFRANEGFDDPLVEIVVDLDFVETRSSLFLLQKIGRAQRICNNKQCGYYIAPIVDENKIDTLNYISELLYDYIKAVTAIDKKFSKNNAKDKDNTNYYNIIAKYIDFDNIYNISHQDITDNIKLMIERDKDELLCKNIMNIIKSYINKGHIVESVKDYHKLCTIDNRLPMDPEVTFKYFPGWTTYLHINRNKYYSDPGNVVESIQNTLKIHNCDSYDAHTIYNYCRGFDEKIPPMPEDFYKNYGVNNINFFVNISFGRSKRRFKNTI